MTEKQRGKVFEIRENQSVEIIEGQDLTPGKKKYEKYQESLKLKSDSGHTATPEPYVPKINKAVNYKIKGVKPQTPHPRIPGYMTAVEMQNISNQEDRYEMQMAIIKLQEQVKKLQGKKK